VLQEVGDEAYVSEGLKLAVKHLNSARAKLIKQEKKALVCQ